VVFLQDRAAAGQIVITAGQHAGNPAAAADAVACLDAAAAAARRLHQALDAAQATLTWAAATRE
jgi:hypothetical protein